MATKVNGISYHLLDDCDTLICKLENRVFELRMENEYDMADVLETDLDDLQIAFNHRDYKTMQKFLDKYRTMFKRYS